MPTITEDDWHSYTGEQTRKVIADQFATRNFALGWVLNAGAGIYALRAGKSQEVSVDLFVAPIRDHSFSVCATVERLPFRPQTFHAIVCVGEVLAYCDPAAAIREFARVAVPKGLLICDFGSSRSARHWLRRRYGRAADLVTDQYNGTPEKTWIYDPDYISALLVSSGFVIEETIGIHTFSAVARRIGVTASIALRLQRRCPWLSLPNRWADITTIVAARSASST